MATYDEWHSRNWNHLQEMESTAYKLSGVIGLLQHAQESSGYMDGVLMVLQEQVDALTAQVEKAYEIGREVGPTWDVPSEASEPPAWVVAFGTSTSGAPAKAKTTKNKKPK